MFTFKIQTRPVETGAGGGGGGGGARGLKPPPEFC